MKNYNFILLILGSTILSAQLTAQDSTSTYKKRVLESVEVDLLFSYYTQDGANASVTGGVGTEELTDITPTLVVSIPLNDDDVFTIDAGISAYSSASQSNIDPFDGDGEADPFVASSGSSSSDSWIGGTVTYAHSSDDRNSIWSAKLSYATEYDYTSFGLGGSYTKLFNDKNTEVSIHGNVYLDTWKLIYPIELRPFANGGAGLNDAFFKDKTITGNQEYSPLFTEINSTARNSYSFGLGFSQILSRNLQGSLALDFVLQDGLLSTPFHRINFGDIDDSFIEKIHLADAIEKLPDSRTKIAIGGRLNYYINEIFVVRTYYRYYTDDWGISSHTASIEIPIKIGGRFTVYPSYRFYNQTAADYFAPYEKHASTEEFFTSDYDLSKFTANQYGLGVTYTDIFTNFHISKFGLKSIDLKYLVYDRDSGLSSSLISLGFKFVID